MNFIQKHFKTIIYISFLVPILLVAFVSISHVTTWYGLSNPITWSIYLSAGIEIAALSSLAAISANMGRKVYIPFGIVTLIQFVGNVFFAYQFIDINSILFKNWVELVDPIVSYMGVESGDIVGHKRFLSLFSGGLLPIISLSFLHMLVKFEEEEKIKSSTTLTNEPEIDLLEISKRAGELEKETLSDFSLFKDQEVNEENLKKLEDELKKINDQKFGFLEDDNTENVTLTVTEQVDDSHIEVEPDFYKDENPDYNMEEEVIAENPVKRLNYIRNR